MQPFSTKRGQKKRWGGTPYICNDGTTGNVLKLKEGRLRLNTVNIFFIMEVMKHWHRLPRIPVDASSLEVLKARSDGAMGNTI